ncbi:MAG: hypothetical protein IKS22_04880 [Bacteroidales bacterium]|nr:hypothetical protein [Bacteroidales bacterium]
MDNEIDEKTFCDNPLHQLEYSQKAEGMSSQQKRKKSLRFILKSSQKSLFVANETQKFQYV